MIELLDMPNELIWIIGEELSRPNLNSFIKTNRRFVAILTPLLNRRAIQALPGTLFKAATCGHENLMKLLLGSGVDVNVNNGPQKRTALTMAAEAHHVAIVKLLLERGADVTAQDVFRDTPVSFAIERRRAPWDSETKSTVEIVKLFLENGLNVDARSGNEKATALCLAAGKGSLEVVKLLLEKGANVHDRDINGNTPLSYAARHQIRQYHNVDIESRVREIIKLLLGRGADINSQNANGDTPLFRAMGDNSTTVQLLFDLKSQGGDLDFGVRNNRGRTVLHAARFTPIQLETLNLLLAHEIDINAVDSDGRTPLHSYALSQGCEKCGQLLIDRGADSLARDNQGNTVLHLAVRSRSCRKLRLFLENGADINALNNSNETPLRVAVSRRVENAVRIILDRQLYTDAEENYSARTLALAATGGSVGIVKLLLEKEIDTGVPRKKDYGCLPLHCAAESGHEEVVRLLLMAGVSVRWVDSNKDTVLHCAARSGFGEIVKLLLDNGASVMKDYQNANGETVFSIATVIGFTHLIDLFQPDITPPNIPEIKGSSSQQST